MPRFPLFVLLVTLAGCSSGADHLSEAVAAVAGGNYEQAREHARRAAESDPDSAEAVLLLAYLPHGDGMLHAAFWEGDDAAVAYLAGIVADIDAPDARFGAPLLVLAAAWERAEIVETLLTAGADPNGGSDRDGHTALMWSVKQFDANLETTRLLLEAGADPEARSRFGETALDIAVEYRNEPAVALLREHGAAG